MFDKFISGDEHQNLFRFNFNAVRKWWENLIFKMNFSVSNLALVTIISYFTVHFNSI